MVVLRSLVLALAASGALAQKTDECVEGLHVIAVRGHGREDEPYGLSSSTISNLTYWLPDTDAVGVPYAANREPDILASVDGARLLKKWLRRYTNSCPDTKIVLQGYSQGAIAVMSAMCGGEYTNWTVKPIAEEYGRNVISIVTFGDETRVAGAPYNAGTCTQNAPHARVNGWECGPYNNIIKAWCDSNDIECCDGGKSMAAHYKYPQKYNLDVVWWVAYNWWQSFQTSSGSPSASTSSNSNAGSWTGGSSPKSDPRPETWTSWWKPSSRKARRQ